MSGLAKRQPRGGGRRPARLAEALRPPRLAALAAAAVGVTALEVARPSLPVPFELDTATRLAAGAPPWAPRAAMALAAAAALIALYIFIMKTIERRAAGYAVAVLVTTPAWFVHGRTMTGSIVSMAASAIVLAGTGVALLDPEARPRVRALGLLAAASAIAAWSAASAAGLPSRGLLVVAAAPLLATGMAGLLASDAAPGTRGLAWACVLAGAGITVAATAAWAALPRSVLATWLVGARAEVPSATSLQAPIGAVAYGLLPWSPFVPFALARRPRAPGHVAIVLAGCLSILAHAATSGRQGPSPIVGVAALAGAVALGLREVERARTVSAAWAAGALALGFLVAHDVSLSPDRALTLFGATDVALPAAHAAAAALAIRSAMAIAMVLSAIALLSPQSWLPTGRGLATIAAGVLAGLVLRAHAYPGVLAGLSPGAAFDAWARVHRAGEPLGLVGVDRRVVAFAPGTAVVAHRDARSAGQWLARDDEATRGRRFLALAAAELPRVNAEWRAARGGNVPVLAGRDATTLLATSTLTNGERSDNPLDAILPGAAPSLRRPVGAVIDDRLEMIGWELTDARGAPIEVIARGTKARLRVALRVLDGAARSPVAGHCTFVHVDHTPARFAREHKEHPYPMALWRAGDIVIDDYELDLPTAFRKGGYALFYGVGVLPCDDDRRMPVSRGPVDGRDRIPLGTLEVR